MKLKEDISDSSQLETWLENVPLKNGKLGKRWVMKSVWYTPLKICELCGKIGTPKKVHIRNDCYGWNCEHDNRGSITGNIESKSMLCMGCWNKVRVIVKRHDEARDNMVMLGQLQRRIASERKQNRQRENQNNRGIAGLPRQHDDRGEERRP